MYLTAPKIWEMPWGFVQRKKFSGNNWRSSSINRQQASGRPGAGDVEAFQNLLRIELLQHRELELLALLDAGVHRLSGSCLLTTPLLLCYLFLIVRSVLRS